MIGPKENRIYREAEHVLGESPKVAQYQPGNTLKELDVMQKLLYSLTEIIDKLDNHLAPVSIPLPIQSTAGERDRSAMCSLAAQIEDFNSILSCQVHRLICLNDSIDI